MGRHSKTRPPGHRHRAPRGLVEMVDISSGDNHLLTPDAVAAGRSAPNRYRTLCGTDIIPAALTDPGTGYCRPCRSGTIPAPRAQNR